MSSLISKLFDLVCLAVFFLLLYVELHVPGASKEDVHLFLLLWSLYEVRVMWGIARMVVRLSVNRNLPVHNIPLHTPVLRIVDVIFLALFLPLLAESLAENYELLLRTGIQFPDFFLLIIYIVLTGLAGGLGWAMYKRFMERDDIIPLQETGVQISMLLVILAGWLLFCLVEAGSLVAACVADGACGYPHLFKVAILLFPFYLLFRAYRLLPASMLKRLNATPVAPPGSEDVAQKVEALSDMMGLSRSPRVYWSDELNRPADPSRYWLCSPVTFNSTASRPVIVLPGKWKSRFVDVLDYYHVDDNMEAGSLAEGFVLLHELSHIRNGDARAVTMGGYLLRAVAFSLPLMLVPLGIYQWLLLLLSVLAAYAYFFSLSRNREYLADARATLLKFFTMREVHFLSSRGVIAGLEDRSFMEFIFSCMDSPRMKPPGTGLLERGRMLFMSITRRFARVRFDGITERVRSFLRRTGITATHPAGIDRNRAASNYLFSYNYTGNILSGGERVYQSILFGITCGVVLFTVIYVMYMLNVIAGTLQVNWLLSGFTNTSIKEFFGEWPALFKMLPVFFVVFMVFLYSMALLRRHEEGEEKPTIRQDMKRLLPALGIVMMVSLLLGPGILYLCCNEALDTRLHVKLYLVLLLMVALFTRTFLSNYSMGHIRHRIWRQRLRHIKQEGGVQGRRTPITEFAVKSITFLVILAIPTILFSVTILRDAYVPVMSPLIESLFPFRAWFRGTFDYDPAGSWFFYTVLFSVTLFISSLSREHFFVDRPEEGVFSMPLSPGGGFTLAVDVTSPWYSLTRILTQAYVFIVFMVISLFAGLLWAYLYSAVAWVSGDLFNRGIGVIAFFGFVIIPIAVTGAIFENWSSMKRVLIDETEKNGSMLRLYRMMGAAAGRYADELMESLEFPVATPDGDHGCAYLLGWKMVLDALGVENDGSRHALMRLAREQKESKRLHVMGFYSLDTLHKIVRAFTVVAAHHENYPIVKKKLGHDCLRVLHTMAMPGGGFKNSPLSVSAVPMGLSAAVELCGLLEIDLPGKDLHRAWVIRQLAQGNSLFKAGREGSLLHLYSLLTAAHHLDCMPPGGEEDLRSIFMYHYRRASNINHMALLARIARLYPRCAAQDVKASVMEYNRRRLSYYLEQLGMYSLEEAETLFDTMLMYPSEVPVLSRMTAGMAWLAVRDERL